MKTQLLKMTPREFCVATSACSECTRFALKYKTMHSVWEHCPRVDWLCWILNELDVPADEKAVRLYMVWCARNTPMHDGRTTAALLTDQRSQDALAVAEQFANGQATQGELSAAESAAESAAWSVARSAAESAAESVAWSAAWSAAQSVAWSAAQSVAWSAQADQFRIVIANPFV